VFSGKDRQESIAMGIIDQLRTGRPDDPGDKGPQTRRVKAGEVLCVVCLEDQAQWYVTHFLGQLTRPCLGDACLCKRLDTPVRTRWTGWILAAESMRPLTVRLVALTEHCWDTCDQLRDPKFSLFGKQLRLTRAGATGKGRVSCSVDPYLDYKGRVPRLPYSQRDQLLKVWFSEKAGYDEFNKYAHDEWLSPDQVVEVRQELRNGTKGGA
jgi:hypothetical protein